MKVTSDPVQYSKYRQIYSQAKCRTLSIEP